MTERTGLYHVFGIADLLLYIGVSNNFGRRWTEHAQKQPWWNERQCCRPGDYYLGGKPIPVPTH